MRRIVCFAFCLLMLLPLHVQADTQYVIDQADILTETENQTLNATAESLSKQYGVDVYMALISDMDGMDADTYAVYLNSERGWWNSDDAVLFLLAMEERVWYIATFGEAMYIFPDQGLDLLGEAAISGFSEGYYEGLCAYLELIPSFFRGYDPEVPESNYGNAPVPHRNTVYYGDSRSFIGVLPVSLLIGAAVGGISLLIMRTSMNTKRRQRNAADYLKQGSFRLRQHRDLFLYSNVSKVRKQQNTASSGAQNGNSIHRSSGGRSHGGRGGRF